MRHMTRSPRSIYRDFDLGRDAKPRSTEVKPHTLRLVPPVETTPLARATPPRFVKHEAPASESPVATQPQTASPRVAATVDAHDLAILSVLDEPAAGGESADAFYRRKERELGAMFARLPVPDAVALARRLSTVTPGDILSARFSRLVADRRQRLIDFLDDAKRREAIENARQPNSAASGVKGSKP